MKLKLTNRMVESSQPRSKEYLQLEMRRLGREMTRLSSDKNASIAFKAGKLTDLQAQVNNLLEEYQTLASEYIDRIYEDKAQKSKVANEATGVMNQLELRRSTFEDTQSLIKKCNTLYGKIKDLESKIQMYNHKVETGKLKNKDIYSSEVDALGSELDNARLEYLDKVGQIDIKVDIMRGLVKV